MTHSGAKLSILLAALVVVPTLPLQGQPPDDLELELVAGGFDSPIAVRHAGDGSGRLFVVEQAGVIWIVGESGQTRQPPFLDLRALVDEGSNEQGLLGLAFDPDYASNGFFYVSYTGFPSLRSVVEAYEVSADVDLADAGSGTVLLSVVQDFSNHNGGDIHFGPDGYLYLGLGDGGSGGDPFNRAQNLQSLLGKMLRIGVDGPAPYSIPADNPFVGNGGARDEIWAYGLRNPWRFGFDRITGDLLIGDVGQGAYEEVDFQPGDSSGGENYGWDCREGAHPFGGGSVCAGPVVDPVLEYSSAPGAGDMGCSVIAGFPYRGHRIARFEGTYVYADHCSNRVWLATETTPGTWSASEWTDNTASSITSFGEDEAGELYVVSRGGSIYRFASPSSIFVDGFESGDTSAWTP